MKRIFFTPLAARLVISTSASWLALGASLKMYLRSVSGVLTADAGANEMVGTPLSLIVLAAATRHSVLAPVTIAVTVGSVAIAPSWAVAVPGSPRLSLILSVTLGWS